MIPVKAVLEADLAGVGGGIGGLMAAISAAQAGAEKVIILEKAHVRRSGSGATGNDHFRCFLPEYHTESSIPPCRCVPLTGMDIIRKRQLRPWN